MSDALAALLNPSDALLDIAVAASLDGLDLPLSLEVAIEDPRNRDALRRALIAVGQDLKEVDGL